MRNMLTTLVEIVGFGSIAAGCFLVAIPLGLIVTGVCAIVVGSLAGREA